MLRVGLILPLFPPIGRVTMAQVWPVRVPQVPGHCIRFQKQAHVPSRTWLTELLDEIIFPLGLLNSEVVIRGTV